MCCVAGLQTARQFDSLPIWKLAMHQCRRFCRSAIRLNAIVHHLAQCTYLFAHYSSVLADFGGASVKSECGLLLAVVQVSL